MSKCIATEQEMKEIDWTWCPHLPLVKEDDTNQYFKCTKCSEKFRYNKIDNKVYDYEC